MKTLLLSLLLLVGCTDPKYVQESNSSAGLEKTQADCTLKFQGRDLCLSWKWETYPTESSEGSMLFKTYRFNRVDKTVVMEDAPSVPQVVLWMPSMGHGSTPVSVTREDVGTYRARKVFFIMPGEWEIKFQLQEDPANEVRVTLTF